MTPHPLWPGSEGAWQWIASTCWTVGLCLSPTSLRGSSPDLGAWSTTVQPPTQSDGLPTTPLLAAETSLCSMHVSHPLPECGCLCVHLLTCLSVFTCSPMSLCVHLLTCLSVCSPAHLSLCVHLLTCLCVHLLSCLSVFTCSLVSLCSPALLSLCVHLLTCLSVFTCSLVSVCSPAHLSLCVHLLSCLSVFTCSLVSLCSPAHLSLCVHLLTCLSVFTCSLVSLCVHLLTCLSVFTCSLVSVFTCSLVSLCSPAHLSLCVHLLTCLSVFTCSLVSLCSPAHLSLCVHLLSCLCVHLLTCLSVFTVSPALLSLCKPAHLSLCVHLLTCLSVFTCSLVSLCSPAHLSLCVHLLSCLCVYLLTCLSVFTCSLVSVFTCSLVSVCSPAHLSLCVHLLTCLSVFTCSLVSLCSPAHLSLCVHLLSCLCVNLLTCLSVFTCSLVSVFTCSLVSVCSPAHLSLCVHLLTCLSVFTCSLVSVCSPAHLSLLTAFGGFASTDDPMFVPTASGVTIALECPVNPSRPTPNIQWFMDDETAPLADSGINIRLLEDSRFLYLHEATSATIEYHCEVTNARMHETVSGTRYLVNGTGLTDGEYVYKEIGNRTASVGELNFVFSYIAADGLMNQVCIFHIDGTPVPGVLGIATVISPLSTPGDHSLTCQQGTTVIGNPGTLTVYGESIPYSEWSCVDLSIHTEMAAILSPPETDREVIVGEGSETFPCVTTGTPTPTLEWFINGQRVTDSTSGVNITGQTLSIPSPQVSHSGVYQCFASNEVSEARASWAVEVREPSEWVSL